MKGHFPQIKFVKINSRYKQVIHVLSESKEVSGAKGDHELDMEIADLLHSCETYFRIRENEGLDVEALFRKIVEKNQVRGYYA